MKKRAILSYSLLAAVVLNAMPAYSQDIRNAELNAAPLAINPAFTGMFNGDIRTDIMYSNHWSAASVPWNTYALSADMPIFSDNHNNYLAAGFQVTKNLAGDIPVADFSGVASIAYHKSFTGHDTSGNHSSDLAIGIQAGYDQNSMYLTEYYINGTYPLQLFSGNYKLLLGNTVNYYPLNAGISFSHAAGANLNYTVGVAGYNLNQPGATIGETQYKYAGLDRRYIAEAGAAWMVANGLTLRPGILFQYRGNTSDIVAGNEFHYSVEHHYESVFAGAWYHSAENATTFVAGTEYKGFRLGLGYSYYYSSGNDYINTNGAFTIAIKYTVSSQKIFGHKRVIPSNCF